MSLVLRNKLFPGLNDDFFSDDYFPSFFNREHNATMPSVNISEDADNFKIDLAAPGLDKKDFKIEVKNNMLTISSEKEEKHEDENEKFMRKEFCYCAFRRSFGLPQTTDVDKIKAKHNNGILSITIPKKDEAREKPLKQIEIK